MAGLGSRGGGGGVGGRSGCDVCTRKGTGARGAGRCAAAVEGCATGCGPGCDGPGASGYRCPSLKETRSAPGRWGGGGGAQAGHTALRTGTSWSARGAMGRRSFIRTRWQSMALARVPLVSHGGVTTTGPDATHPPTIFQNSGGGGELGGGPAGGRGGGGAPPGGRGGGCSCRGVGGGSGRGSWGCPARGERGGV